MTKNQAFSPNSLKSSESDHGFSFNKSHELSSAHSLVEDSSLDKTIEDPVLESSLRDTIVNFSDEMGHCFINDLHSSNGTWIKLLEKTKLHHLDEIQLGKHILQIRFDL